MIKKEIREMSKWEFRKYVDEMTDEELLDYLFDCDCESEKESKDAITS